MCDRFDTPPLFLPTHPLGGGGDIQAAVRDPILGCRPPTPFWPPSPAADIMQQACLVPEEAAQAYAQTQARRPGRRRGTNLKPCPALLGGVSDAARAVFKNMGLRGQ